MKNLFKLGLDYKLVEPHSATVNKLLGIRNAIAHGDSLKIPKQEELDNYISTTFGIMGFVQREIYTALKDGTYEIERTIS